jgi:hypothetical protein
MRRCNAGSSLQRQIIRKIKYSQKWRVAAGGVFPYNTPPRAGGRPGAT